MAKNWAEDRAVEQEVKAATSVNKDAVLESILTGRPIEAAPSYGGNLNESSSIFHMDRDLYNTVAPGGMAQVLQDNPELLEKLGSVNITKVKEENQIKNLPKISSRQYNAIKKFPALVEFLGSEYGEKIASEVANKVNEIIIEVIGQNAQKISKYARTCVADKYNIKQYYSSDDNSWVCKVVANGPFRGDEAILYDHEQDVSMVVRIKDKQYENISEHFNIIHERANQELKEVSSGE